MSIRDKIDVGIPMAEARQIVVFRCPCRRVESCEDRRPCPGFFRSPFTDPSDPKTLIDPNRQRSGGKIVNLANLPESKLSARYASLPPAGAEDHLIRCGGLRWIKHGKHRNVVGSDRVFFDIFLSKRIEGQRPGRTRCLIPLPQGEAPFSLRSGNRDDSGGGVRLILMGRAIAGFFRAVRQSKGTKGGRGELVAWDQFPAVFGDHHAHPVPGPVLRLIRITESDPEISLRVRLDPGVLFTAWVAMRLQGGGQQETGQETEPKTHAGDIPQKKVWRQCPVAAASVIPVEPSVAREAGRAVFVRDGLKEFPFHEEGVRFADGDFVEAWIDVEVEKAVALGLEGPQFAEVAAPPHFAAETLAVFKWDDPVGGSVKDDDGGHPAAQVLHQVRPAGHFFVRKL